MKLENSVVLSDNEVARSYTWLQTALVSPPSEEEARRDFLLRGLAALREEATAIANRAFQKGVEFARRNPPSPEF